MASLKKLMSDYGLGAIIILLLLAFAISTLSDYINNKALGGSEGHANLAASAAAYSDGPSGPSAGPSAAIKVLPADGYAPVSGAQSAPTPYHQPCRSPSQG